MKIFCAFLRRDILIQFSYSFRLVIHFGSFLMSIFFIFFISRMIGDNLISYFSEFGNNYFPYAITGMAVSTFISTGLYSFSSQIRTAQVEGTLEILLMAPVSVYTILVGNSLWSFVLAFLESFVYLFVVAVFPGVETNIHEIIIIIGVLFITFTSFLALGMISAAFILVFKQGNPINLIFGASSYFLGGFFFPIEVMPKFVQFFSRLLPAYHSVQLVRKIMLGDSVLSDLGPSFFYLCGFTLVTGFLGVFFFNLALKAAKKNGSLIQF